MAVGKAPEIVTEVPPAVGPEDGVIPVIALNCTGGGGGVGATGGATATTINWTPEETVVNDAESSAAKSTV
jgi:hypothetical protein